MKNTGEPLAIINTTMNNMIVSKQELQEIRREMEELRDEVARLQLENSITESKFRSSGRTRSPLSLEEAIADQLLRQGNIAAIEKRVTSLERRLSELEERHRAHTSLN